MESGTTVLNDFLIERIVSSRDNWTIASGTYNDGKNTATIIGNFYVLKGEQYSVTGIWQNSSYGVRLSVKKMELIKELSDDALIQYLRTFRTIGSVRATEIVKSFGNQALEVIRTDYRKLLEIQGITEEVAFEIWDEVGKADTVNNLLRLLKPKSVSMKTCTKIAKKLGHKAPEIIKGNPYMLFYPQEHISFETAEILAKEFSVPRHSECRIKGFIYKELLSAISGGDCFMVAEVLIDNVIKSMNKADKKPPTKEVVFNILCLMEQRREVVVEDDTAVYLPSYYFAEKYCARKLNILRKSTASYVLNSSPEALFEDMCSSINISYAPEQQEAIIKALAAKIMVITGGPGVGKTTTINGVIKAFLKNNPQTKIVCAAPTGKAAQRMEESTGRAAKTIHRMLEYKPTDGMLKCMKNEQDPIQADIIIVDESSMIDLLLFQHLLQAVNPYTKVIFVGDVNQLPSVGAGNVLNDLIESNVVTTVRLTQVFRQAADSPIVSNAYKINDGIMPDFNETDFTFSESFSDKETADEVINLYLSKISEEGESIDTVQILTPMKRKTCCGSKYLNKIIQEKVNPSKGYQYEIKYSFGQETDYWRLGDKVIQLKNNYEKECYNGTVGHIVAVNYKTETISVKFEDKVIDFTGREEITELELAYALTIHKSQGSEYKTIIVPVVNDHKNMLAKNLLYTAVTRAKQNVHTLGEITAWETGVETTVIDKRNSKLRQRIIF